MNTTKIIHTADWHFDCKFTGINSRKKRRERQLEQRKTFKDTVTLALEKDIDFFLISGDLFEQNSFTLETINFIIFTLSQLKCQILISPGNHDPYINESPYKLFNWGSNVHIFKENKFVPFKYKNTVVYGIANTHYNDNQYCLHDLKLNMEKDFLNILMLHGTYCDFIPYIAKNDICFPFTQDDLKNLDVNYVALGHFHESREINISEKSICYPGTPEGTNFSECGPRFINLAEISEKSCKIDKIQINQRSFIEHKIDITGINNQDALYEKMRNEIFKIQHADDLLRVILTGTLSLKLNFIEVENQLNAEFYYINIINKTNPVLNIEELAKNNTITGEFKKNLEEKINKTNNEEDKKILQKAMYYGLKALINKEDIELDEI